MRHLTAGMLLVLLAAGSAAADSPVRTGGKAFGDWTADAPDVVRKITPADLPAPYAKRSLVALLSFRLGRSKGQPKAPPGFVVLPFARLEGPRAIQVAPNGDIFVAETAAGQVSVLRARDGAVKPQSTGCSPRVSLGRSASPSTRRARIPSGSMSPAPMRWFASPMPLAT